MGDVEISLRTIKKVVAKEGISSGKSVTMEAFRESRSERESNFKNEFALRKVISGGGHL